MPTSAQSRCLPATYHWLPGSLPTRIVPSPGTMPFVGERAHPFAELVLDRGRSRLAVQDLRCHEVESFTTGAVNC